MRAHPIRAQALIPHHLTLHTHHSVRVMLVRSTVTAFSICPQRHQQGSAMRRPSGIVPLRCTTAYRVCAQGHRGRPIELPGHVAQQDAGLAHAGIADQQHVEVGVGVVCAGRRWAGWTAHGSRVVHPTPKQRQHGRLCLSVCLCVSQSGSSRGRSRRGRLPDGPQYTAMAVAVGQVVRSPSDRRWQRGGGGFSCFWLWLWPH